MLKILKIYFEQQQPMYGEKRTTAETWLILTNLLMSASAACEESKSSKPRPSSSCAVFLSESKTTDTGITT